MRSPGARRGRRRLRIRTAADGTAVVGRGGPRLRGALHVRHGGGVTSTLYSNYGHEERLATDVAVGVQGWAASARCTGARARHRGATRSSRAPSDDGQLVRAARAVLGGSINAQQELGGSSHVSYYWRRRWSRAPSPRAAWRRRHRRHRRRRQLQRHLDAGVGVLGGRPPPPRTSNERVAARRQRRRRLDLPEPAARRRAQRLRTSAPPTRHR